MCCSRSNPSPLAVTSDPWLGPAGFLNEERKHQEGARG